MVPARGAALLPAPDLSHQLGMHCRGNNFAKTMLRLAHERAELEVINDQIGTPTGAEMIADYTAHALHMAMA